MPKPILIVNYCIKGIDRDISVKNLREIQNVLRDSGVHEDYYIFVLPVTTDSHVQVFYEKDLNEIKYSELKSMIEEKLKSFKE
jgi:hypothetical protein